MTAPTPRLDPQKLSPADAAKALVPGQRATRGETTNEADVAAGAPKTADGTRNLVQYAAWLIRQLAEGGPHGD